jgi:hypothetical protein
MLLASGNKLRITDQLKLIQLFIGERFLLRDNVKRFLARLDISDLILKICLKYIFSFQEIVFRGANSTRTNN